jgi:hypothetical protein
MLRALEKGIKFNLKKLQFTLDSVKFFEHIFTKNAVKVDPERISAINDIPIPKNSIDVQRSIT